MGVGKERGRVLAVGAREGQQGVRARVPAAGKVLEGADQRTLSPLYYDVSHGVRAAALFGSLSSWGRRESYHT